MWHNFTKISLSDECRNLKENITVSGTVGSFQPYSQYSIFRFQSHKKNEDRPNWWPSLCMGYGGYTEPHTLTCESYLTRAQHRQNQAMSGSQPSSRLTPMVWETGGEMLRRLGHEKTGFTDIIRISYFILNQDIRGMRKSRWSSDPKCFHKHFKLIQIVPD